MTEPKPNSTQSPTLLRLMRNEPCYSLGLRTARNLEIVRIAKAQGYHKIWVDLEHSSMPVDLAGAMCATARDLGMDAWVRIPEGDFGVIGRVLDAGASGLILPQIHSAAEARHAAGFCRYPPDGARSHNTLNAGTGFRRLAPSERIGRANRGIAVQVLLESPEAIGNAAEIAAVPGVDIISLGLNDLSAACGAFGDVRSDRIGGLCRAAIAAARSAGKLAVIGGIAGPEHFSELRALGAAPYVFAGIDTEMLVSACEDRIALWRAIAEPTATDGNRDRNA